VNPGAPPRPAFRAALLVFGALAIANFLASRNFAFIIPDAWAKLVHYRLGDASIEVFLASWARNGARIVAAAVALGALIAIGRLGLRFLGERGAGMALSAGAGMGLAGLGLLGLGLAGGLFSPVAWAGALAACAWLVAVDRPWRDFSAELSAVREAFAGRTALAVALALMAVPIAAMALGPEVGWDPVYYHLRLPKLYELRHRVWFVPYIYPSHYPQTVEMAFTLSWLLGGEGAARVLNACLWPLSGLAVFSLARPFGTATAARTVAIALTLPVVGTLACESYSDLALTLLEVLALERLLARQRGTAAVLLGFAMGTKYTGIFAAVGMAAAYFPAGGGPARAVTMALVAAIPVLPWLVKNWFFTSDPVAPFLYPVFGGPEWGGGINQSAMAEVIPKLMPVTWVARAGALLGGLWGFLKHGSFAVFSPFLLGLIPVIILRAPRPALPVKAWFLAFTALALVLAPDGRYWQPAAFPLSLLVALAWGSFEGWTGRTAARMVSLAGGLCIAFGVAFHTLDMHRMFTSYWTALGLEPEAEYEERTRMPWPWYPVAVRWINRNAPVDGRVGVVSDVQAYMLDRDAIFDCDAPGSRRWLKRLVERMPGERDLARQFRQWNMRTIFYIRPKAMAASRGESWTTAEVRRWRRFIESRARVVWARGQCAVYELGAPRKPSILMDLPGPGEALLVAMEDVPSMAGRAGIYAAGKARGVESAYTCVRYGEYLAESGRNREAAGYFRRALAIAPGVAGFWFDLAIAETRQGRTGLARDALARGLAIEPLASKGVEIARDLKAREGGRR